MGIHTYVTEHLEDPGSAASVYYATTVSPGVLEPQALMAAVQGTVPDRPMRWWQHELTYPNVVDDPVAGVQQVEFRYRNCARCHLSSRRTMVSFVKGNPYSPVVLFGEGPGQREDTAGVPFVGPAGRLEDELLRERGIDPMSLAWMNLVGCRPQDTRWSGDRPPTEVEKVACSERTWMLFRALRPSVVVCLGAQSTCAFFDEAPEPWTWHTVGTVTVGHARHPSYLARTLMAPGGEKEYEAARHFYDALAQRLPHLQKLPTWDLPLRYLGAARQVMCGR